MLPLTCFYIDRNSPLRNADALMGYAVLDDAVIFGTAGLEAYRAARPAAPFRPTEGRFAAVVTEGSEIEVRTDVTGQEVVYAYLAEDFWAASNSFALVAAGVARHHQLALYGPAVVGFHLKGGVHIGEQLLSHKTMVEGIEALPATAVLRIDLATRKARIERRGLSDALSVDGLDYEAALIGFIEKTSGLLAAIAHHAPGLHCQLSGGYDSRTVLALLLAGTDPGGFEVQSFPSHVQDYPIAQAICDMLGLRLNTPRPTGRTLGAEGQVLVWELSCLGVYLPIYPVQNFSTPRGAAHVRVTGDLASDWKFFRGRARFNGDAEKIARDIREDLAGRAHAGEVAEDFLSMFALMDIDPAAPFAMELYYNLTRSRFHCGRHWYKELGASRHVTPLASSDLLRLEILSSIRGWDRRKLYCDLLLATDPRLALHPFDRDDKRFPEDLIDASPFRRGYAPRPHPFTVFAGEPAPPPPIEHFCARHVGHQRDQFADTFRARFARIRHHGLAPWFTAEDLARANAEVASMGSLSHGLRKATHAYSVAGVLGLIAP